MAEVRKNHFEKLGAKLCVCAECGIIFGGGECHCCTQKMGLPDRWRKAPRVAVGEGKKGCLVAVDVNESLSLSLFFSTVGTRGLASAGLF